MKWFTKKIYPRISDAFLAVYNELQSLQPRDTSTVRWVKGENGMEAHVDVGQSPSRPTEALESFSEDVVAGGHFRIGTYFDTSDEQTKVVVSNTTHNQPPPTAIPSLCAVQYIRGTTTGASKIVFNYEVESWLSNSHTWGDGLWHIYLAMPFRDQPYIMASFSVLSDTPLMDYFQIGTVMKTENFYEIAQEYEGDALVYDSYSYSDAFKLSYASYTETIPPEEEGGEPTEVEHSEVTVQHGAGGSVQSAYLNNFRFDLPSTQIVEAQKGDFVYIHIAIGGESGTASIKSGSELPQSANRDVYYLLGEISEDGSVYQAHIGPAVYMKWYIICDEEA